MNIIGSLFVIAGLIWGACYALESYAKGVNNKTAIFIILNIFFWWIAIPIKMCDGSWFEKDMKDEYDFSDGIRGKARGKTNDIYINDIYIPLEDENNGQKERD